MPRPSEHSLGGQDWFGQGHIQEQAGFWDQRGPRTWPWGDPESPRRRQRQRTTEPSLRVANAPGLLPSWLLLLWVSPMTLHFLIPLADSYAACKTQVLCLPSTEAFLAHVTSGASDQPLGLAGPFTADSFPELSVVSPPWQAATGSPLSQHNGSLNETMNGVI